MVALAGDGQPIRPGDVLIDDDGRTLRVLEGEEPSSGRMIVQATDGWENGGGWRGVLDNPESWRHVAGFTIDLEGA